jgi:cell filamentation protein
MVRAARPYDYDVIADPYCYPKTTVLINVPGIRDAATLADFETAATAQRADEPLPRGRLSVRHYRAVHHHLFQDVYAWAGGFRTIRLSKDGSAFCYPEHVAREMRILFADLRQQKHVRGLPPDAFAPAAAHFLATLNAIHPFREGNGRTQMSFLALLADQAGHPLALERLDPGRFLAAMIGSFHDDEQPLATEIRRMLD